METLKALIVGLTEGVTFVCVDIKMLSLADFPNFEKILDLLGLKDNIKDGDKLCT